MKAQRLSRISYLLYRHPRGLKASELAKLCNVTSRTILRDLRDLEEMGIPLWDGDCNPPRYSIIAGYYLPPVHLTLDNALALYLSTRLLARYADNYDPHIVDALSKLSTILPEPIAESVQATASSLMNRQPNETFCRVMSALTLGWATGRKVRIRYLTAESDAERECVLCPYLIEPSAVGNSTHVVGHASHVDALRTFKVERIVEAQLLTESFEVPENFDGLALLNSAWGIMFGDETQEVVLRFAPVATRRVKETCWHSSQCLEDTADGGCVLRLWVAHPEEMRYWILGWGPQVEVLAPASLRDLVAGEARAMAAVYDGEDVG
ncbi:MAG: helix-turn-helix transcriptional regulator [Anaerolineae bacterium]